MKVKIVAVPAGEAPLVLREQWVGVEIPIDPILSVGSAFASTMGVRSRGVISIEEVERDSPNDGGIATRFVDCMVALRAAGRAAAAEQWEKIAASWPPGLDLLIFGRQFCEVIED